jgi:hypothetical protein
LLLSNDPQISTMFLDVFASEEGVTATHRATLISRLRAELFETSAKFDPNRVPYFFPRTPDQLRTAAEAIHTSETRQPEQA